MKQLLVEETRNGWLECEHYGAICGVGPDSTIPYALGDIERPMFLRSAGKPLQAIPVVQSGALERYELNDQALALMTASHRGESIHMETMNRIMAQMELDEHHLICLPTYPLNDIAKVQWIREGGFERRAFHNCAGKHFGVLGWSKLAGYELDSYTELSHPAQQQIVQTLADMSETPIEHMQPGTDGCGFPVFALPLRGLATAYLKLACPELIADESMRSAVTRIAAAMQAHPLLVGGTGRIDSVLMEDDNIVAKGGFKGIFAFALRKEQLGFAFKVADGSDEEWALIVASILEQIGYERTATIERIKAAFPETIYNDNRIEVGRSRAVFTLQHED
ncbi:asparaginase [Paenibacillus sp. 481]|uniref:asparaginase n=1 Tax=Paenibacillus sp. 481 TaxID=2835869 RepID=UPI001E378F14|nr:asparaginase [Paenibacillus sp. 481]UHA74763.1 asparaginase [Paenibacillus sp. 481]